MRTATKILVAAATTALAIPAGASAEALEKCYATARWEFSPPLTTAPQTGSVWVRGLRAVCVEGAATVTHTWTDGPPSTYTGDCALATIGTTPAGVVAGTAGVLAGGTANTQTWVEPGGRVVLLEWVLTPSVVSGSAPCDLGLAEGQGVGLAVNP